jgi:hypothetical protein
MLTQDKITGELDRKGAIRGFARQHTRSAWPDVVKGKLLTDHRIEHYQALGFYGPEGKLAASKRAAEKKLKLTGKERLSRLMRKYQ